MVIAKHPHYEEHGLSSQPETAKSFLFFWLGDPAGTLHVSFLHCSIFICKALHSREGSLPARSQLHLHLCLAMDFQQVSGSL